MTETTPNQQTATNGLPGLSAQLQAALAGATNPNQPVAPGSASIVAPSTLPQEHEVDEGGGLKRRVPLKDLESAWLQRQQLAKQREALDQRFADAGQLQALQAMHERLAALPADRRAQVLALLEGKARGAPAPGAGEEDELDAAADEALGKPHSTNGPPAWATQLMDRLEKHDQALNIMAGHVGPQMEMARQATTAERVTKLMADYPVFAQDSGASVMAKNFIMSEVAKNRQADLDSIVKNAASMLHDVHAQHAQRAAADAQTTSFALPKGALTARGLKAGDTRRAALAAMQGLR